MMGELAKVYKEVLNTKFGGQIAAFDYSSADFDKFWSSDDQGNPAPEIIQKLNGKQALVIAWDGKPDNDKSDSAELLYRHLTPLDWALAFSIKLLRDLPNSDSVKNGLGIHIIDLTGRSHTIDASWAMHMRHQLLAEMPWVTLHAPLIPRDGKNKPLQYRKGYLDIVADDGLLKKDGENWQFVADTARLDTSSQNALCELAKQWTATLTQTGDHHDLNNIAGPHIVSKLLNVSSQIPTDPHPLKRAFLTRIEWSRLLERDKQQNDDKDGNADAAAAGTDQELDIVAIDDQLSAGWDDVLIALTGTARTGKIEKDKIPELGSGTNIRLFGSDTPSVLLEQLGITADGNAINKALYEQRVFDSLVEGKGAKRPWMLVLDIRLFMGKPSDERNWYQKLAKAALALNSPKELAWPGFDNGELKVIASGDSLSAEQLDTALSLLPRLCALRWPSVPIIVFSSTGRRRLVAKLADYGNIFLANQKPNVLNANCAENVASFAEGWRREFSIACKLTEVQKKLLDLLNKENEMTQGGEADFHHHFVIAIDEAGKVDKPPSRIGGAFLVAPGDNKKNAINCSVLFQEKLRESDVNYYNYRPIYTDSTPPVSGCQRNKLKQKDGSSVNEVQRVLTNSADVKIGAFKLALDNQSNQNPSDEFIDAAYRRGLAKLLEILLAEFIPSRLGEAAISVSIWIASKQSRDFANEAEAAEQSIRYDFRRQAGNNYLETIGGWSVAYSVLLDAIAKRECFDSVMKSMHRLRVRMIPYVPSPHANHWYCETCGTTKHPRPKSDRSGIFSCNECGKELIADYSVMAHLADEYLKNFPGTKDGYPAEPSFCFSIMENTKTDDFLACARLIDCEQEFDGIKLAYKHDFFRESINQFAGGQPIESRLRHKFVDIVRRVDGNTLIELSGLFTRVNPGKRLGRQGKQASASPVASTQETYPNQEGQRNLGAKDRGSGQIMITPQLGHAVIRQNGSGGGRNPGQPGRGGAPIPPKKHAENYRHHGRANSGIVQYTVTLMIKPGYEALPDKIIGVIGQFVDENLKAKLGQPILGKSGNGKPKVNFKLSVKQDAENIFMELNKNKEMPDAFWSQVFLSDPQP